MKLLASLDNLFEMFEALQLPVCSAFNEGLDESVVRTQFDRIGLEPIPELIELYGWRNGTNIPKGSLLDNVQLFPGFHFLSLEDSIVGYLVMKDDERWNENWFPVFANGGGDFYAVDLSSSDHGEAPVIGFILGEVEQSVEYQSVTAMLYTFLDCYEKEVIYVTEDGYLEMDDTAYAHIAASKNPDVDFWKT